MSKAPTPSTKELDRLYDVLHYEKYNGALVDELTRKHNDSLKGQDSPKGPTFFRSIEATDIYTHDYTHEDFHGGVEYYKSGIDTAKDGDYALIINTGDHFVSVSVKKTGDRLEYTWNDSATRVFGGVESLGKYLESVNAIDTKGLAASKIAKVNKGRKEAKLNPPVQDEKLNSTVHRYKMEELDKFRKCKENLDVMLKGLFGAGVQIQEKPREVSFLQPKVDKESNLDIMLKEEFGAEYSQVIYKEKYNPQEVSGREYMKKGRKELSFFHPDLNRCGPAAIMAAKAHCDQDTRDMLKENTDPDGHLNDSFAKLMVIEDMCRINPALGYLQNYLKKNGSNLGKFACHILDCREDKKEEINPKIISDSFPEFDGKKEFMRDLLGDSDLADLHEEDIYKLFTTIKEAYLGSKIGVSSSIDPQGWSVVSQPYIKPKQEAHQATVSMDEAIEFCEIVNNITIGRFGLYTFYSEIAGAFSRLSYDIRTINGVRPEEKEDIIKRFINKINNNEKAREFLISRGAGEFLLIPYCGMVPSGKGSLMRQKCHETIFPALRKELQPRSYLNTAYHIPSTAPTVNTSRDELNAGLNGLSRGSLPDSYGGSAGPYGPAMVDMPGPAATQGNLTTEQVLELLGYIKDNVQNGEPTIFKSFLYEMSMRRCPDGIEGSLVGFLDTENMSQLSADKKDEIIESVRKLLEKNSEVVKYLSQKKPEFVENLKKFVNKQYDKITEMRPHTVHTQEHSETYEHSTGNAHEEASPLKRRGEVGCIVGTGYNPIFPTEEKPTSWVAGKLTAIGNGLTRFVNYVKRVFGYSR